ncbi:atrial natriuretic peptide receptor 3-like, partial [Palaemon carinicauda]|uniref:atrial natriuretic peptide receptor 3-like n=1 Tax=Palaemon carinicauda TaxID=392227 RepID=UPI0035B6921A
MAPWTWLMLVALWAVVVSETHSSSKEPSGDPSKRELPPLDTMRDTGDDKFEERRETPGRHPSRHPDRHHPVIYRHAYKKYLRSSRHVSESVKDTIVDMLLLRKHLRTEPEWSKGPRAVQDQARELVPNRYLISQKRSPPSETCLAERASKLPNEDTTEEDHIIDFAVIVPCNASHQYSRVKVLPVVELAVRHLRETGLRGPLANYTIKVRYRDSKTSSTDGPLAAVDLYFNKFADVFLGPVDGYVLAPVARFSGRWNVPLLTPGGQPLAFDSKKDYPLLTRLKGFHTEVGQLFSSIGKHWNWEILGIIYEENDSDKGHSVCHFTLASIYTTFHNRPHFEKFQRSVTDFDDLLSRFKDKARILVMCGSPGNIRRIMLAAYRLNMITSGNYAFFNIEIFSGASEYNRPWYNASDTEEANEMAKKAYEALLTVTTRKPTGDHYKNFSAQVRQIAEGGVWVSLRGRNSEILTSQGFFEG